ncbi:MAG: YbaB/EbfC family nucleoid-associated protein [Erysipelotrichaceae bacterium]|nr:YbaB/EbfC family nucleoid-associated protein [Erysipelotrichaceae bacterium]
MDFDKLLEQAQKMQKDLEKMNEEMNVAEFEGSASNGLVKVVVNGDMRLLSVDIDESILNREDKEMIEDLLVIAFKNAAEKVDVMRNEKLTAATGGLGLPRF